MADDEETSWVFDSLVGFLKGPVWNIPILTFIEQKSVVFEPGEDNDEEYKKIHEEYKNLVDFMLGSHMEDLGITPEQFDKTCSKSSGNIHSQFHQSLFEQVWAADDYEIFKRMMTQKNIELQLQALEILAQRFGLVPESMVPEASSHDFIATQDEEKIMEEVLKRSLEEHEREKEMDEEETKQMEQAIQATLSEKSRLEAERQKEKERLDKAMKDALTDPALRSEEKEEQQKEQDHEYLEPDVIVQPVTVAIDPEEIKRRQGYLRKQRDRLLALKKQEREKQLALYEESAVQTRPKSARAAKQIIQQDGPEAPEIDSKTLAFRKSLAARLKAEVVGMYDTERMKPKEAFKLF